MGKISNFLSTRLVVLASFMAPFSMVHAQTEISCSTLEASLTETAIAKVADYHDQVVFCLNNFSAAECGGEVTYALESKLLKSEEGSEQRRIAYTGSRPPSEGGSLTHYWSTWTSCGPFVKVVDIDNEKKQPASDQCVANPIYPMTGNKRERVSTGLVIGGQELTLTYDTSGKSTGKLWLSSLHHSLEVKPSLININADRGNGRVINFELKNGLYTASVGVRDTLTVSADGYIYTDASAKTVETYDKTGQAIGLVDAQGNVLSYVFSNISTPSNIAPAPGYLITVSDQVGRSVKFEYTLTNGVTRIIDNGGQDINISYDAFGNLTALTWEDGMSRKYVYENTDLPWALTGVVDENGSRFATWAYNPTGQVISSQHAGGTEQYSVDYNNSPPVAHIREVYDSVANVLYRYHDITHTSESFQITLPNGSVSTSTMNFSMGYPQLKGSTLPPGSGCAASNNATTFDVNGNISSQDDFTGTRTCFARDSLSREIMRIEGLAKTVDCLTVLPVSVALPVGARRIATAWHSDWDLPVTVAVPGSLTTNIYHGKKDPFNAYAIANCTTAAALPNGKALPLVCKKVVQATVMGTDAVDAAVPNKVTTYSYDAAGRMLTSKDALNNITTHTYYNDSVVEGGAQPNAPFSGVSLLLHGDAADGSTSILNASLTRRPVTGNATIRTAQSKFGGSAMYFNGSSYLTVGPGNEYNFGTRDFTIETWLYVAGLPTERAALMSKFTAWTSILDFYLGLQPNGTIAFFAGNAIPINITSNTPLTINSWHHVAVVRSSGTTRLFIDGLLQNATHTGSVSISNDASILTMGQAGDGTEYFVGYLDEIQIVNGTASYSASFTPPSAPFVNPLPATIPRGHTAGDLQSVTGPTGFKTTFDLYDSLGRVLQTTDPKGIVTAVAYTPRGWVSTVTTTAPGQTPRLTSYSYDGVGQLTGVSNPDGTSLSYRYDAAHRLIGVTDAQGNTVSYTLDNMGNKIAEQIKDPSGVLQRSIARSFDALNRLQQISGAPQ